MIRLSTVHPALALLSVLGVLTCIAPAAAKDDAAAGDLTVEGVADPTFVAQALSIRDPVKLEQEVCSQTYRDALLHLGAYTRGVPFAFDYTLPPQDRKERFSRTPFQPAATMLPKAKSYRVLQTHLVLGRITFAARDVRRMRLPEGLAELPTYVAPGRFPNDLYPGYRPSRWPVAHWMAALDCYRTAIAMHLARTHGNREVAKVSGRAFPVRVVKAVFEPVEAPEDADAPEVPEDDAPKPQPDADGDAPETPAQGGADAAAESGPAAPQKQPASTRTADPRQIERYFYRLEMEVRIQIDDVTFTDEAGAGDAPPTTPAEDNGTDDGS